MDMLINALLFSSVIGGLFELFMGCVIIITLISHYVIVLVSMYVGLIILYYRFGWNFIIGVIIIKQLNYCMQCAYAMTCIM